MIYFDLRRYLPPLLLFGLAFWGCGKAEKESVSLEEFELLKQYATNVKYEEVIGVSLIKTTLDYHADDAGNFKNVPSKITVQKYDSNDNELLNLIYFTSDREVFTAITKEFDEYGNTIYRRHYHGENKLDNMNINKNFYDSKWNLIKVKTREISFYNNDTTDKTYNYRYDDYGNKIGGSGYNLKIKYNSMGLKTEVSYGNSTTFYNYDSKGLLLESRDYRERPMNIDWYDKRNVSRNVYRYDSSNRNIEILDYNSNGSLYKKIEYIYDSNNRKIVSTHYKTSKNLGEEKLIAKEKYIFEYDER
tara:strand:+ start:15 stop:923 length:909 start_codon:yes stop_codon:yes gene_type:complete